MKRVCVPAALAAVVLIESTGEAHAYLDPGTGSMLLQGLVGGIAAASVAIGVYWGKLKALLFRSSTRKPQHGRTPDVTER